MAVPNPDYEDWRDFGEYVAIAYYIWITLQLSAGTQLDAAFKVRASRFLQQVVLPPQQQVPPEQFGLKGTCSICGRVIKAHYADHMKSHREYNNWDYNCKFRGLGECDNVGPMRKSPARCIKHMVTRHFKFDTYKIPKSPRLGDLLKHKGTCGCGYYGVAEKWLHDHVLRDECPLTRVAPNPLPTPYQCSVCGKRFKGGANWVKHFKSHRGTWNFDCKFRHLGKCGKYKGPSKFPHACIRHMINTHFKFDGVKHPCNCRINMLFREFGKCKCGYHGLAKTWVYEHVLRNQCPLIEEPEE
ncbi:hypothetical protein JNB11_00900 [Kocuria palustris]|nr:hypothetical protein [Kocuria palustris]